MRQRTKPVVWLTAITLVMAVCYSLSVAQDPVGGGPTMPYGVSSPWPRQNRDAYESVPQQPYRPVPVSRPESWPGTPAPARQWQGQGGYYRDANGRPIYSQPIPGQPAPPWPPNRTAYAPLYPPPHGHPAIASQQGNWQHGTPPSQQVPAPNLVLLEGANRLAQVGSETILAAEVMAGINGIIEKNKGRFPAEVLEKQKELLIRQKLKEVIKTKLIYLDAVQTIPSEAFPKIQKDLRKQYDEKELPRIMKQVKVETRRELDEKLQGLGTSLERRRRAFVEQILAQQWVHTKVKFDREITYDEMIEYYRDHGTEFDKPARVRWKELMARFSKYPTKAEAGAAIARMGNQVSAGVPFEQVAKANSHGSTASDGGVRDWTTKGSLVSKVLDRELFNPNLPVGRLSPILESDKGFHIILIVERELAHRTPFLEAQTEIEPKIKQRWLDEQVRAYVQKLRDKTPVWTIFDEEDARKEEAAKQNGGAVGSSPRVGDRRY